MTREPYKDAEEKVRQLLEHVDAKINDPEKADTEPEWVFWCLFVDAAKIFVELTGKTPTTVYLPFATMGMLQRFVNKFKEPFDVRYGIMGMTVVPGSRSVWFEA